MQPVEMANLFRSTPSLLHIRPGDAEEAVVRLHPALSHVLWACKLIRSTGRLDNGYRAQWSICDQPQSYSGTAPRKYGPQEGPKGSICDIGESECESCSHLYWRRPPPNNWGCRAAPSKWYNNKRCFDAINASILGTG